MIRPMFKSLLAILAISGARAAHYDVSVGDQGKLVFKPPYLNAGPGDMVTFHFNPKKHSVTQSSFQQPCVRLEGGFDTDFVPVDVGTTVLPTRDIMINSTDPVWVYCRQVTPDGKTHCGLGMVFAVNPTQDKTFEMFKENANKTAGIIESASSSAAASSIDTTYTTPPAPSFTTVTVTVTAGTSTYTTTYASYEGTGSYATPNPQPVDHVIQVGPNKELKFEPNNIKAQINDTVTFMFNPKNHTVTQSTFLKPCELGATPGVTPFDSGFNFAFDPVTNAAPAGGVNFTITVNDSSPIWIHCAQVAPNNNGTHCGKGMVAAINAPTTGSNTFDAFQKLAAHFDNSSTSASGNSTSTKSSSTAGASPTASGNSGNGSANGGSTQRVSAFMSFLLGGLGAYLALTFA